MYCIIFAGYEIDILPQNSHHFSLKLHLLTLIGLSDIKEDNETENKTILGFNVTPALCVSQFDQNNCHYDGN